MQLIKKKNINSVIYNKAGYTIVELIIYIALIGTLVSGIVLYSLSVTSARNKNYVAQEVQANGRFVLDVIGQRIRAATGVNAGSSTFDFDPGVLSLSMSDSGKDPTIIDLTANDGQLQITEGVSSAVSLTSDEVKVTNLVFTNKSNINPLYFFCLLFSNLVPASI